MIGFLLVLTIFAAPALAVYSVFNRMQNLKTDQTGYVYNGKMWVSDVDNNSWEPGVYGWSAIG